jgi:hypothetical protein
MGTTKYLNAPLMKINDRCSEILDFATLRLCDFANWVH